MAAIRARARIYEPSSELPIESTWCRRTSLPELWGVTPALVHTDRLYAALDQLLPHKNAIKTHLKLRCGELFALKCDRLLYDINNTCFAGEAEGNPLAQRGCSRASRPDRPQACIGQAVTEGGFPLGHEVFAGNTHDSILAKTIIARLKAQSGSLNRMWSWTAACSANRISKPCGTAARSKPWGRRRRCGRSLSDS